MLRISRYLSISCLFLLLAANAAKAQRNFFAETDDNPTPKTFYGGFTIGANFTQVDGDGYSGYHKVGLNVGPLVYARFNNHFGASMEMLFSQKGSRDRNFKEDIYGVQYQDQYDIKLNYVEVPFMLRYFAPNRLQFGAGVSYSRLLNSKESAVTNTPVNLDPNLYPFKKDDWQWMLDANYEFYKGWFIGMRYAYSFTSIRDGKNIPEYYGGNRFSSQFNNVYTVRVTCLIH